MAVKSGVLEQNKLRISDLNNDVPCFLNPQSAIRIPKFYLFQYSSTPALMIGRSTT
jgi:hypothetical protein